MKRSHLLALAAVLALGAALAGLASLSLPGRIHHRLEAAIREQIVWRQESPLEVHRRYSRDTHPGDPPVYLRLYFFNITNLEAVRQGAKPVLAELGPYTYYKHRVKTHVWFNRDGRVKFKEWEYHVPAPELTNGSLDDPVTTLNIPLIGALEVVSSLSPGAASTWLHMLASLVESWGDPRVKGLFTTRTVRELLWGYQDQLLASLAPLVPGVDPTFQLLYNMSSPLDADAHFATQINTGLHNISEVWQYEEWDNVTKVTSWNPPHVERVRGTDAFQFRPGLALNDSLEVWVGELYRAARVVAQEQTALGGVPLLRFRADPSQGDPDERFFQHIRGLMNITSPKAAGPSGKAGKPGPPLFLSYPHFCLADERLAEGVEGIDCDPPKHDLFLDVEPTTGITLRAAKRLMLSSWFGAKWRSIDPYVRDTFLPIFWAEESSQATAEQLAQFGPLLRAKAAAATIEALGPVSAVILAVIAAACAVFALWRGDAGAVPGAGSGLSAEATADTEQGEGEAISGGLRRQAWQQMPGESVAEGGCEAERPLLSHHIAAD